MKNKSKRLQLATRDPACLVAFGFGSGLMPFAPGTFGTLAAIPFYLCFASLPPIAYLTLILIAFLAGIWLCDRASKKIGGHDHPSIVWDEFVGLWLTLFLAPPGWIWIALGFILFRVFDIFKFSWIGKIDRHIGGGLGIMLDDMVAGMLAWVCLQVIALGAHQWL